MKIHPTVLELLIWPNKQFVRLLMRGSTIFSAEGSDTLTGGWTEQTYETLFLT
jgi:hypothetical protein